MDWPSLTKSLGFIGISFEESVLLWSTGQLRIDWENLCEMWSEYTKGNGTILWIKVDGRWLE